MQTRELDTLANEILSARKYRDLDIPIETVRDLLAQEQAAHRNQKEAVKAVRHKLHTIVAPYLGDPDYSRAGQELTSAFASGDPAAIQNACLAILNAHSSTRERVRIMPEFYARLFAHTGVPHTILDLACGLQPFAIPWMGLPPDIDYYACDLNHPRVDLINLFLRLSGLPELARHIDVLLQPPAIETDVAFLFKEAHRIEQRKRGATRELLKMLKARHILVSLPSSSLSGRFDLVERQRALVASIVTGTGWRVSEIFFETELVFCVEKGDEAQA